MFFVPISSDAPLYYFPWATIGLIAACTLVLFASTVGVLPPTVALVSDYALAHGDGLHPLQWLTSNFLHDGWVHLIGNMMFLWAFGLIVEGKTGWRPFLAIYLGLGAAECCVEQLCLPAGPPTLGASSIVFGILAIAAIWAPRNGIDFAYGGWSLPPLRIETISMSVLSVGLLMIAKEAAVAAWLGFSLGSELFHLVGAALGVGVACSMLRARLVDCEGWDVWTLWRGRDGQTRRPLQSDARVLDGRSSQFAALAPEVEQTKRTDRKMRALKRIHKHLDLPDGKAALAELRRTRRLLDDFALSRRDLERLINALEAEQAWSEFVECNDELLTRFELDAPSLRLRSAALLIAPLRRPAAALAQLQLIAPDQLVAAERAEHQRLLMLAERQVTSGTIELQGQNWESP
ncbi:MAG: rhomboid family intramembrane serine protease [Planctomycetaceae bacterium]